MLKLASKLEILNFIIKKLTKSSLYYKNSTKINFL